jgi:hypothetical protein
MSNFDLLSFDGESGFNESPTLLGTGLLARNKFRLARDSVSTRKIGDSPMRVECSVSASAILQQPLKTRDEEADSLEQIFALVT